MMTVRSFKNLLRKRCASESIILLVRTAIAALGENPVITTPKAVPPISQLDYNTLRLILHLRNVQR